MIYQERRSRLLKGLAARGLSEGLALFPGNGESPMNYLDNTYPFRQDSSFLYFFGLAVPGLAAAIDLGSGRATLFADDASIDDIVWTGPLPSAAELAALAGADEARPRAGLAAFAGAAAAAGRLHFLPCYREDTRRELAELLAAPAAAVDGRASLPLLRAALELRELKGAEEVAELETAVATSVAMHRAALDFARPGQRESDVAARVTEVALAANGALAFPVIATTRGATLHNHDHGGRLEEGSL
ncbi:MAG: aminopeptidase P N-terminal domain-containing protein, partial [Spirochaetaceae bacterium]|nr:aminopeptidase P N-terminal domain-containing protein [Spirochaetaceae bacterium]